MTLPRTITVVIMQIEPSGVGAPIVEYTAVNHEQRCEVHFVGQTGEFSVWQRLNVTFSRPDDEPQDDQQQWKWADHNLGTDEQGRVVLPPEAVDHRDEPHEP